MLKSVPIINSGIESLESLSNSGVSMKKEEVNDMEGIRGTKPKSNRAVDAVDEGSEREEVLKI